MLDWKSDSRLSVDGTEFTVSDSWRLGPDAAPGTLLIRKPRWMIERYVALQSSIAAKRVVELGIYEGGGTVLLDRLFVPDRLVAVDLSPTRVDALDRYAADARRERAVHAYFGVDQSDRARLGAILNGEFDGPLDLVIDDASHLLAETVASFNVLFPRLRPGGLFVVEDWSCQLEEGRAIATTLTTNPEAMAELSRRFEAGERPVAGVAPLARLVTELVLIAGCADEIVAEVMEVRRGWAVVRRGDGELDPTTFDVDECYRSFGGGVLAENG